MSDFPISLLRKLITKHLDVRPSDVSFRRIPTGKFNSSYYVETPEKDWILRIAPPKNTGLLFYERGMMAQEPPIHALLRRKTGVPVARIIAYDNTHTLIDRDYLIMERLPGRPLNELPLAPHQVEIVLEQVGRYLRQMHRVRTNKYGYLGPHQPMEPQDTWLAAFRVMWNKLLDDIVACGGYEAPEADYMRHLFEVHRCCFERRVPSCLLHMDVWHQNILVDERLRVTGLLDLDRALWGDPEIEFAVLDYCGISEPAFWRGYGRRRDTSPQAQIRRIFYLLYEVQKYIAIRIWRGGDRTDAMRYKEYSFRLASSLTCAIVT